MTNKIKVKRGDTLSIEITIRDATGTVVDLTGAVVTSQVRDSTNTLIEDLLVNETDLLNGRVTISATDVQTATWAITTETNQLFCDVKRVLDGRVTRTPTFEIEVEQEVTA